MSQKFKDRKGYEPIPIPISQWFREFRIRVIPIIVFIAAGIFVYTNWTTRVVTPDFIGAVYAEKAEIIVPASGIITNSILEPFQRVRAGEVVARVVVTDPLILETNLAVINAQIEYLRNSREPEADLERNRINIESMNLDLMQEKIELSSLKIKKLRASQILDRNRVLLESNLIAIEEFEQLQFEYDIIKTELHERELLVQLAESRLEELKMNRVDWDNALNPTMAAIEVEAQRLRLVEAEMTPVEIRAPIDGVVRFVNKKNGVAVIQGDLFAEIEANEPQYIVGFVRQPFSVQPETGMKVEVRSRRAGRKAYTSEITDLGAHIIPIDTLLLRPGLNFETGLPVKISLSNDISFFPGEVVDLILRP